MKNSVIKKILTFFYEHTGGLGVYCHYIYTVKIRHVPYFGLRFAAGQQNAIRAYLMQRLISRELEGKTSFSVLEIGSWAGESAVIWAGQMKKSPVDGKLVCIDPWALYAEIGEKYSSSPMRKRMGQAVKKDKIFNLFLYNIKAAGYADVISYHRDLSENVLPGLAAEAFDIVYVDGSHHYKDVMADLKNSLRILKTGGVICGDDLELQVPSLEAVIDLDVVRRGTGEEFPEIPTHMGVTVAVWDVFRRKVTDINGFWAMRKTADGFEEVDI